MSEFKEVDELTEEVCSRLEISSPTLSRDSTSSEGEKKLGLLEGYCLNAINMFGTGPLITLPFLLRACRPQGPQALIGYACAVLLCFIDSWIWAELGSRFPGSGGSQHYLLRALNSPRASFLFVWQFILAGPLEVASGFIGSIEYLRYTLPILRRASKNKFIHGLIGAGFATIASSLVRYELSKTTLCAAAISLAVIVFIIITGFTIRFKWTNLKAPGDWHSPGSSFSTESLFASHGLIFTLGRTMRIGIYDMTGYFDINFIGDTFKNPKRIIPLACILSAATIGLVYFAVYIAVLAALPWDGNNGFVARCSRRDQCYVGALFAEKVTSSNLFARVFALLVALTIFGSSFALLVGYATIPAAAAKDGLFFSWFAKDDGTRSLYFIGALSAALCFIDLEILIEAVATTRLLAQFAAQAFGLWLIKYNETNNTTIDQGIPSLKKNHQNNQHFWRIPAHPLPEIFVILGFSFVFITSPNYIFHRQVPLLESGILVLLSGLVVFSVTKSQCRSSRSTNNNSLPAAGEENKICVDTMHI